jgi:ribosome-binding factor A
MSLTHRPQRVGDQIRQELSSMLSRGEVHDPGIGFITLTRVTVSADLQVAHVYYTTLGDEAQRKATEKALTRATPYLRRQIGQRVQLRRVPEISFRLDLAVAHQDRIEQVLRDLHAEAADRASVAPVDASDPAPGAIGPGAATATGTPAADPDAASQPAKDPSRD